MDTERWKSILVPRDVYEEIKATAKKEGRTIGGQLRLAFEQYQKQARTKAVRAAKAAERAAAQAGEEKDD
jgi:hypothetical protein